MHLEKLGYPTGLVGGTVQIFKAWNRLTAAEEKLDASAGREGKIVIALG